ncbi:MAG TPA: DUF2851 family protein, partial [Ktedonobacteraceae bacterium]|nr:DUF2851 family protein [Ktedonobacteraceae bacterium]
MNTNQGERDTDQGDRHTRQGDRDTDQGDRDTDQGDRKGRPYYTTKRLAKGVYKDEPRGCPGILELDLVHRWLTLPLAQSLPLTGGSACQLLYAGRPGGPQGPDIRDAVLQFAPENAAAQEERITGDVEFHIRCSDWYTHRHHTDVRYNNVILHVVLIFDSAGPILRQNGQAIPICSLNDLVPAIFPQP